MRAEPTAEALRAVSRVQGPYVGLQPYDEADAAFFFGRSQESAIVAANLRSTKLTILYGPSGVGKSSLLMAGVVHGLREQARTGVGDSPFAVCVFRSWHHEPLSGLQESCRAALQDLAGEHSLAAPVAGQTLTKTLRAWTTRAGALLIVLDQFEEYFQYCPDDENGDRLTGFAGELAGVVNNSDLPVHVLLSIREDAWASLDRFEGHIDRLFANYLRVDHLDRNAARDAIIQPIGAWNRMLLNGGHPYEIEQALVESVIDAAATSSGLPAAPETAAPGVAGTRVEAPFLQLVLERLWRATVADGGHALTLARLEMLGGPQCIVESHLAHALDRLSRDEQDIASDCFAFLVSRSRTKVAHPGVDLAEWTRREEAQVYPVLDELCRGESGRILRTVGMGSDDRHGPTYELYHDVLAEPILAWRRTHDAERDRRRLLRIGGAIVALVAVVAALGSWAFAQHQSADRAALDAKWLAVASTASSLADINLAQSLLLALAAEQAGHTPQARSAMTLALQTARQSGVRVLFTGHVGSVTGIAFSPSGRTLASVGDDGTVRLWNVVNRSEVGAPLRAHSGRLTAVAFSPDGRTVASGGLDGAVRVWSIRTHHQVSAFMPAHAGAIVSLAYSPNGQILAAGESSGSVALWSIPNHAPFGRPLAGDRGSVTSVAFSPDGRRLASVVGDGTVRLWSMGRTRNLGRVLKCIDGLVYSVSFSRDGRLLACGGDYGRVQLWSVSANRRVGRALTSGGGAIVSASFSEDGRVLAGVGEDGRVRLWDLSHDRRLGEPLSGRNESILSAQFSPTGNFVAGAGSDGTVFVWDLRRRNPTRPAGSIRAVPVTMAAFSPTRPILAGAGVDGAVRLWRTTTWAQAASLGMGGRRPVLRLAFSPSGQSLAAADETGQVRVWDIRALRSVETVESGHAGNINGLALDRGGRTLAVAGDGGVVVWRHIQRSDHVAGTRLPGLRGPIMSVAFSPDGRILATGGRDGKIRLWDIRDHPHPPQQVTVLAGHVGEIFSVAFASDGSTLAGAGADGQIRLWGLSGQADAEPRPPLIGHTGPVFSIAFSPNGRTLASGGGDGTVRLWSARGYKPLGVPLRRHLGSVSSVEFSPDGLTLEASYQDGSIRLWKGVLWRNLADLRAQVCGLVSDDLTPREWRDLAPGVPQTRKCSGSVVS